ncbi:DUF4861 family protein [Robertkochia solimangrovi]|uniref:DUF4861 family protein n=1 Tax=Robertkochia solimangrovi TaxID=2213046 RepID=UPI00117EAB25|nr:DUF4861 family protein [Robertkochia solimangrovi]TRZ46209.1 DUF4861 domain-containing protein [Robertkochia solimangrovi]
MKKLQIITAVGLLGLVACKQEPKASADNSSETVTEMMAETTADLPKTYAEISIKEGGEWVGRKYEGGDKFVNVDSLTVPASHTDHSYYIRYEGPGWESNKIGYRLYLDWRNAIDIFGKLKEDMILDQVGQDNFDSYHEMSDWGADILKAGKSLGVGSLARFYEGATVHFNEVDSTKAKVANYADHSAVDIAYYGWQTPEVKTDLSSELSIKPDSRLTKHHFVTSEPVEGLCTGIVKFEGIDLIKKQSEDGKWACIATWGEQSLVPDKLGMVVFYQTDEVDRIQDSEFDHLIIFKPTTEPITYYLAGAWEKEPGGITSAEEFDTWLNETLSELSK